MVLFARKLFRKGFEKIRANSYRIRTLEKLRHTLLPKLMSGEMQVKMKNDA